MQIILLMRIFSRSTIVLFYKKHTDAEIALKEWFVKTKAANWSCFAEIKETFNSVDAVGNDRFVFNIKGNDYRLVACILFNFKVVYIKYIGTHADYSKQKDVSQL